jgi:hypothetical protein
VIAANLSYLRDAPYPQRVLGLETMPKSPYNLGFYTPLGFEARFLTFLMGKSLEGSTGKGVNLSHWSLADSRAQKLWITDLQNATEQIHPGLDYSKKIISTAKYSLDETFLLTLGRKAVGLSIVWFLSGREGVAEEQASVQMMVLHPAHTADQIFRILLDGTEAQAQAHNKQKLTTPVNACHALALERLIHSNYRFDQVRVRMVLEGTDAGPLRELPAVAKVKRFMFRPYRAHVKRFLIHISCTILTKPRARNFFAWLISHILSIR